MGKVLVRSLGLSHPQAPVVFLLGFLVGSLSTALAAVIGILLAAASR